MNNIKKLEYWAEELVFPFFIYSNTNSYFFQNNFLAFHKGDRIIFYFVNDRPDELSELGYEYFSNGGFEENPKEVKAIKKKLELFESKFKSTELSKLSNSEFNEIIFEFLDMVTLVSEGIFRTEAPCLRKFEDRVDELEKELKAVGEARWTLGEYADTFIYSIFDEIFEELNKRTSVSVKDLMYYSYEELMQLINSNKKVGLENINNRKSGFVYGFIEGEKVLKTGDEYENLYEMATKDDTSDVSVIKGFVACKGSAKGIVRKIIHNKRDISEDVSKFIEGEVLVTEMTRPQTMVACKKAAAIITDEGGITCHAAIISREFNIPCIIGTKNATKILKDGDMVEVNTEKGIVTIIS